MIESRVDDERHEPKLTRRNNSRGQPWFRSTTADRRPRQKLLAIGNQKIEHSLRWRKQHLVFSTHNEPLPHNGKTDDIESDQPSFFKLDGHRVRRNEGDAEAGDDGSILGWSFAKAAITKGTKYFAVLTAPIDTRPPVRPAIMSNDVAQLSIAASMLSKSASNSCSASVRIIPSLVR
jgi:hypothetical protein